MDISRKRTKNTAKKRKKAAVNNSRTRAEKAKAQEEYTEVNKAVKRSIRSDKQNYVENLATEAEQAAREGNMKKLYDINKKLTGNYNKSERPVKDKEGRTIDRDEQQRKRWMEHFEELLNRPAPENTPNIQEADMDLPIDCNKPTREEIRKAIQQLKNGKSAGPDNIPAEALKANT